MRRTIWQNISISVQEIVFSSTRQLNSTGSAVLHGSGTARLQTSRYCRAELNSQIMKMYMFKYLTLLRLTAHTIADRGRWMERLF